MKKTLIILFGLLVATNLFGITYVTGDKSSTYLPHGVNVKYTSSFTTEAYFTKIVPVGDGYYEVEITSHDAGGSSLFVVPFTYYVKVGDVIRLRYHLGTITEYVEKFVITDLAPNKITFEKYVEVKEEVQETEEQQEKEE